MSKLQSLDFTIRAEMQEYSEFKDYDDANMIGIYRKMTITEKNAVDTMFVYLTGRTFNEIALKYESQ